MKERVTAKIRKHDMENETQSTKKRLNESPGYSNLLNDRAKHLQRTMRNQEVQRLIKSGTLQAKLEIGQPNDIYEREADRLADHVMRMTEGSLVNGDSSFVQRRAEFLEFPEKEEDVLQRQPMDEKEELVQAKRNSVQTPQATPGIESRINSLKGGGQPLSESTRSFFEPRFGTDFGRVRIHTGAEAAQTAQSVNARAFTIANNIVFNGNQYSPESNSGKQLLAHELTHVTQGKTRSGFGSLLRRWASKDHKEITNGAIEGMFQDKKPDKEKVKKLSQDSASMDLKSTELHFNAKGKIKNTLKDLQKHYMANEGRALNHGEGGLYLYSEFYAQKKNLSKQQEYIGLAKAFYNWNTSEDAVMELIADALHVTQDRGAHGEGAEGQGHGKELVEKKKGGKYNPDDRQTNSTGFQISKKNTSEVLESVKGILSDILIEGEKRRKDFFSMSLGLKRQPTVELLYENTFYETDEISLPITLKGKYSAKTGKVIFELGTGVSFPMDILDPILLELALTGGVSTEVKLSDKNANRLSDCIGGYLPPQEDIDDRINIKVSPYIQVEIRGDLYKRNGTRVKSGLRAELRYDLSTGQLNDKIEIFLEMTAFLEGPKARNKRGGDDVPKKGRLKKVKKKE